MAVTHMIGDLLGAVFFFAVAAYGLWNATRSSDEIERTSHELGQYAATKGVSPTTARLSFILLAVVFAAFGVWSLIQAF
jgi:hypothetical protein